MKILKHGKKRNYTFECDKCGCIFQLNHKELTRNTYLDVDYSDMSIVGKEFIFWCPECGSIIKRYYL